MFGLFKKDKIKQLEKTYERKLEEARDIQRSGDLKAYARALEETEALWAEIEALRKAQKP